MFNYYRMKIKGSGGGPDTFTLTMWVGGAGMFLSFLAMTVTGTGFKSSNPVATPIILSVFYLFFLKFFSGQFKFPKLMLFYSTLIFSLISIGLIFLFKPWALGAFCVLYYGLTCYLSIKQWPHML